MDLRAKGYFLENYDQLRTGSSNIAKNIAKLKSRKTKLSKKLVKERAKLQDEINVNQDNQGILDANRNDLIVKVRNKHITESLQREKQQHLPTGKVLDVFCISNLHYMAHKKTEEVMGSVLSVCSTGIPRIREFALQLAAPKLLQSLEDFTKGSFSAFFTNLEMWSQRRLVEGRGELLTIVRQPLETVGETVSSINGEIAGIVLSRLTAPFHQQGHTFEANALVFLESLNKWHWSTTRAFLRKYGKHSTTAMPLPESRSWNMSFTRAPTATINALWDDFTNSFTGIGGTDASRAGQRCATDGGEAS